MAKFVTAFSLTLDVLNYIEAYRGELSRSAYVESILKKEFESQSQMPVNGSE